MLRIQPGIHPPQLAQAAEQGRGVATYGNGTKLLTSAAQKLEGAIKVCDGVLFRSRAVWWLAPGPHAPPL